MPFITQFLLFVSAFLESEGIKVNRNNTVIILHKGLRVRHYNFSIWITVSLVMESVFLLMTEMLRISKSRLLEGQSQFVPQEKWL